MRQQYGSPALCVRGISEAGFYIFFCQLGKIAENICRCHATGEPT